MENNERIGNFTNDQDLKIRYTVPGVPSDSLIDSATFTVKPLETTPDADALIANTVVPTDNPGIGQVENTGVSGTGTVRFDLFEPDTSKLTPGVEYFYWVYLDLSTGEHLPIERGLIFCEQGSQHA